MKKITLLSIVAFIFFTSSSYSQDGSIDLTFGTGGKVITPVGPTQDIGSSVVIQNDGKILVAGLSDNGINDDFALVRYNTDGSLDNTFGTSGIVTTPIGNSEDNAYSVVLQSDGKIVAAGYSNNGSNYDFALVRYNTNGVLDSTFDTDGIVNTPIGNGDDFANSLVLQSNGKIVVAGSSSNGTNNDFAVVRYNTNGSLDNTFDSDGKVTTPIGTSFDLANAVSIQIDGKIVVAGYIFIGSDRDFAIVRYNADGSLDNTFDNDGKVTTAIGASLEEANAIFIQNDGKILAAGSSFNGSNNDFALVRYNPDGSLDNTFDTDGKVTTPIGTSSEAVNSVVVTPDGKIVAAGHAGTSTNADFALARYNSNGSLDTAFDTDGKVTTPIGPANERVQSIAIQVDGKIVAAGWSSNGNDQDLALVRYNNTISLNTASFAGIDLEFKVYPNPASDEITIQFENSGLQNASVTVTNIIGQTIFNKENLSVSTIKLDLSAHPTGIYLLTAGNKGVTTTQKIIKNKY